MKEIKTPKNYWVRCLCCNKKKAYFEFNSNLYKWCILCLHELNEHQK